MTQFLLITKLAGMSFFSSIFNLIFGAGLPAARIDIWWLIILIIIIIIIILMIVFFSRGKRG